MEPDGDVDILGVAYNADDITWWENDGSENFTEHTLNDNYTSARSVYAIDIEPDGDVDILGVAYNADDITWWENNGSENFTEHTIDGDFDCAWSVYATDLDDDEDVDVLGIAYYANDISWWENDGSENFTKHTLNDNYTSARSVYAIDIEPDGDVDVLGADRNADDITWFENDGSENFTEHTISGSFDYAASVYAIDLDDDSDVDVLGAAKDADDITWWESDLFHVVLDVGTISIDISSPLPYGTILSPQATVKNEGTDTETFDVTCEIDPGTYSSIANVSDLAPGDSFQVTFSPDFIFETGTYTVKVYTQLAGDENPVNDTLEKVIETYDPGIEEGNQDAPLSFSFDLKNNPAKGKVVFNLSLPEPASVSLQVYDVSGRLVDELKTSKSAGYYEIPWTPKTTAGVYFYSFKSPWQNEVGKLVVLR